MISSTRLAVIAATAAVIYHFEGYGVTSALPSISRDLGMSPTTAAWVPAVYLIAAAIGLVPAGALACRLGYRPLFLLALAMLGAGALLCSAAHHMSVLLAGRAMQGLGGGMMAATAYSMIASLAAPEDRRAILGWLGAGCGLGMVLGAPAGGILSQWLSWRMLFVVLAALLIVALPLFLRAPKKEANSGPVRRAGWGGALLLGIGTGGLGAFSTLVDLHGWTDPATLAAFTGAAIMLACFFWHERRGINPLFPPTVWLNLALWSRWAVVVSAVFALAGATFLLPFHLQQDADMSPSAAAFVLLFQAAAYAVASVLQRPLAARLSPRNHAATGLLVACAGGVVIACGVAVFSPLLLVLAVMAVGFGAGCALPPVNETCVAVLDAPDRGRASLLIPLGINFGSVGGVLGCGLAVRSLEQIHLPFGLHAHAFENAFFLAAGGSALAIILLFLPSSRHE